MKNGRILLILLVLLAASAADSALVSAENFGGPAIGLGSSPDDVVESWGAPQDKVEFEAKREMLWIYERVQVLFNNGRVVALSDREHSVVGGQRSKMSGRPAPEVKAKRTLAAGGPNGGKDVAVEDILSEIMQGSSNPADAPAPGIPPNSALPFSKSGAVPSGAR